MVCNRGYAAKSFHSNNNGSVRPPSEYKHKEVKMLSVKTIEIITGIFKSIIPQTINGIPIKYDIREVQSFENFYQNDCVLTITPIEEKCANCSVALRIPTSMFPCNFTKMSIEYEYIQKQVEEMLAMFIRNINKWYENYC